VGFDHEIHKSLPERFVEKKMKKVLVFLLGVILVLLLVGFINYSRPTFDDRVEDEDICAQYGIRFNGTSIERIYLDPEGILKDFDRFRTQDRAYQLLVQDRQMTNNPVPNKAFERRLEKLSDKTPSEREQQLPFQLYKQLITKKESFCQQVAPYVLGYLPERTEIGATIYLTALDNAAAGFTDYPEISYNISHPLFAGAARLYQGTGISSVYNLLAHELHHIGYANNFDLSEFSQEELRENGIVIDTLLPLHREGIATYISHQLTPVYPIQLEWPHYLFEKEFAVRMYINQLNDILAEAQSKPTGEAYNELYQRISDIGFNKKGFYIVGAYMAMTVDEQLGKDTLAQSVSDGFNSYVRIYNSLAEEDMKIIFE
jgi:hypothetical protein